MGVRWIWGVLAFVGLACSGSPGPLPPCDAGAEDRPICGLMNPEDIGFLPTRTWLVVSEMSPAADGDEGAAERDQTGGDGAEATGGGPGRLTAIRRVDLEMRRLYPPSEDAARPAAAADADRRDPDWGHADCPGPPDPDAFAPHGIDVGRRPDGRHVLAVVNHGGREAVELFEIRGTLTPSLEWRGCVPMLADIITNDVAWMPDGGFVVTNFMPRLEGLGPRAVWTLSKIAVGAATGSVLRWTPGGELVEIENSEGSAPNGIEASADGTELFVGGSSVYRLRLDVEGPPRRDAIALDHHPDNLTWTRDGQLLVAGQHGGLTAAMGCGSIRDVGCDLAYSVHVIGPVGLTARKLVEGRGAASVALEVGPEVFVGVFVGDQIMRVRTPD